MRTKRIYEDREVSQGVLSRCEDVLSPQSSVLNPRSSLLNPQSSVVDPQFSRNSIFGLFIAHVAKILTYRIESWIKPACEDSLQLVPACLVVLIMLEKATKVSGCFLCQSLEEICCRCGEPALVQRLLGRVPVSKSPPYLFIFYLLSFTFLPSYLLEI